MSASHTLAQFQSAANELAALLPSDVPLSAKLSPTHSGGFAVSGESHQVALRRVGSQEFNYLLVLADSVLEPLAQSGLDVDVTAVVRRAIEQVSDGLGQAITTEFVPQAEQFESSSAVVFLLQAGAETRGYFVIQIREVNIMSTESTFEPSQATSANGVETQVSPVSAASSGTAASAQSPASVSQTGGAPGTAGSVSAPSVGSVGNMRLLYDVEMTLTAEIGRAKLPVRQILDLTPGAIVELDRVAGSPADLMVNGHLVARGEVVVIDEDYGLRITEILDTAEAFA